MLHLYKINYDSHSNQHNNWNKCKFDQYYTHKIHKPNEVKQYKIHVPEHHDNWDMITSNQLEMDDKYYRESWWKIKSQFGSNLQWIFVKAIVIKLKSKQTCLIRRSTNGSELWIPIISSMGAGHTHYTGKILLLEVNIGVAPL